MSEEKQAAVEDTEGEAQPSPEAETSDAQGEEENRDYVAEALKEWDSQPVSVPEQNVNEQNVLPEPDVMSELQKIQMRDLRRDLTDLVSTVRGDLPADVFEDVDVESWLDAQARKIPGVKKAWDERHDNPARYKSVVNGLKAEYAKKNRKFLGIDDKATEDKELVAHAVRGGSKPAPEEAMPNLGQMNAGEGRAFIKKKFGFDPGW